MVTTVEGALRGVATESLRIFKGVHYGETTAGPNRFRPPVPVQPWDGVRDAVAFGDECYQHGYEGGIGSEDCLVLNLWSPIAADALPVMVFFHGGGYDSLSGNFFLWDGANLAASGEVIVVTVNHRLHILGFLHLDDLTEGYEDCSNVSLQDLVEALRWVRRNIARFGGDPDNVTIFGESGGGAKVCSLMAMPSASGLFHKASAISCVQRRLRTRADASADAEVALEFLGIDPSDRAALETIPLDRLLAAYDHVVDQRGGYRICSRLPFSPVIDPQTVPSHPEDPASLALSKDIPLIAGSNEEELAMLIDEVDWLKRPTNEADIVDCLRGMYPLAAESQVSKFPALVAAYRDRWPEEDLWHLQLTVMSDLWMARDPIDMAERRQANDGAATYLYRFGWRDPQHDAAYAAHGVGHYFLFDHLDFLSEPRAALDPHGKRYDLRDAMVQAWSSFAYAGMPTSTKLPEWRPYTTHDCQTLRFDGESTLESDLFGPDIRALFAQLDVGTGS